MSQELDNHFKEGKFINVDGTNVFTIDQGTGDIIIFIHGFFTTSYSFRKLIPILSQKHRVIAFDLPGIGYSEALKETYSHRLLAEFIYKFISKITDSTVHLVVHDYGGPISFLLLNRFPEKIKTLTVLSSFINLTKFSFYFPLFLLHWRFVGNAFAKILSPWAIKQIYNSRFVSKENPLDDSIIEDYYHLLFEGNKVANLLKICQNVDRTIYAQRDMESGLQKMIGGRQVLFGEFDTVIPPSEMEYLKEKLRLSIGNYIPGKHLFMEESPTECAEKISVLVSKFSKK